MALLTLANLQSTVKKNLHFSSDADKRKVADAQYDEWIDNTHDTVRTAATTLSGTSTALPALIIPANSIIQDFGFVVTTAITCGTGTIGHKVGTAAGGAQLSAAAANSLAASGTSLAKGKGSHTTAHLKLSLGGNAQLVNVADTAYRENETEFHATITTSGSGFTAGAVICFLSYIRLV